jgi:hypothetical protein
VFDANQLEDRDKQETGEAADDDGQQTMIILAG